MRRPAPTWIGACAAGGLVLLAAAVLQARERVYPEPPFADRFLYLRSAGAADRLALSFDAVVADVYWIRAIQHYGRDRTSARPDRFALLEPLLDLTTTLDPHFTIAYRFGAIFLSMEPPAGAGRVERAIALLEKGARHNPTTWRYPYDIGFVHYWWTGDYEAAGRWLERASAMPDAPAWVRPLAAVTLAEGGDRAGARQLLRHLLEAPEQYIRDAARRGLAQLDALDQIDELQGRVDAFARELGRSPISLGELFGGQLPLDPALVPYTYDPEARRVSLSDRSPLWPLPGMRPPPPQVVR